VKTSHSKRAMSAKVGSLTAVAGAVLVLGAPAAVQAQQTVTVTGIRGAIESAISVKKNSDSIVESISSEDIGKLPDVSVAESIARLPGVTSQRTAGRAQQISIRGLAPDFSTALLNGREQVTTGDSRGVEFDQYPSELLSGVDIWKTPHGGLLGQGLSGTVDLKTVRPLEYGKRAVAVNYRKQRTGVGLPLTGDGSRFNIAYIDQFADRKIGIAVGFSRFDENGPQTQRFEAWGTADSTFGAGTVKTPGGFNSWTDQTVQTRDGAMAVLEFRPTKSFTSTVDLFQSKFEKDTATKGFQAPIGFSSAGGYDPGGNLTTATVSGGVATSGTFDNFKGVVRNDTNAQNDDLKSIGWKNELKLGGWTSTLDLSQSTAKRRGGIIETTAGLPGNVASPGNISWTGFDGSNLAGATYSTSVNYGDRSAVQLTDVMGWGGGTALPQAGYSKLPFVDDKLNAIRLSAKTDLKSDFFSSFEGGFNVTDREKTRAYVEGRLVIPGGNPYGTVAVPGSGTAVFNGVSAVMWDPRGSVGPVYDVAAKFVRDIANKDWTVNEKVSTFYGKLDLDGKLAGSGVRGNVGLQLVSTDQSSRAFSVDNAPCPGDVCPTNTVTEGKTYTDFLPSMNLVMDVGKDQVLRMGYSRTLARPTINDMRASLGFGVNATAPGGPRFEGGAGNPKLEPFRANALDVSYERYLGGNKGYFGVAAFHKQLDTYIIQTQRAFDFTPYVTAAGTIPASGTTGILTQPVNGSGGTIAGLELAASIPLGMLAKGMDGFGVQANYSSTKSSVKLPTSGVSVDSINTARIPLPGLSENVGSLAVYFEKNGFAVRVAQRYRSDFVGEVSSFTGDRQLTYVKSEKVMDMQISYELQSGPAKGLQVLFQGYNLGDARYVRYRDVPTNIIENTRYGKTYLFGLNYRL